MKSSLIFLSLFIFSGQIMGQVRASRECGTVLQESEKSRYNSIIEGAKQIRKQQTLISYYYIRVFIHDFISDDASDSAWSYNEIITEFNQASGFFRQYGMCLVLMGVDYPRNTTIKDSFNTANFSTLTQFGHADAIDVNLHKILANQAGNLNGDAYNIPSKYLSLSRGAIGNRSFAHETGHCLGLAHTFETVFCLECPDGSNGTTCGDKIADTGATPDADNTIAANTSMACVYTGNLSVNCNGYQQTYNPEIINIMSYGRRTCRSIFSPLQVINMKYILENVSGFQNIWFDTPGFTLLNAPIGILIIDTDKYYSGNPVQIGNNSPSFNVLVGGNNSQQKIISPSSVVIKPGVKLLRPSDSRGRIHIKIAGYCQE
jgi:hypothetical protein